MDAKKLFAVVFGYAGMALAIVVIILGVLTYNGNISEDLMYRNITSQSRSNGTISSTYEAEEYQATYDAAKQLEDLNKNICRLGVTIDSYMGLFLIVVGGLSFFSFGLKLVSALNENPHYKKLRIDKQQLMMQQYLQNLSTPGDYQDENVPTEQASMLEQDQLSQF